MPVVIDAEPGGTRRRRSWRWVRPALILGGLALTYAGYWLWAWWKPVVTVGDHFLMVTIMTPASWEVKEEAQVTRAGNRELKPTFRLALPALFGRSAGEYPIHVVVQ